MRYIYFDDGTRETLGSSFSLPRRTTHGIIGRNSSIPVLRHFHSLIPCETIAAATRDEAGITVSETGKTVRFTETVPVVVDGETQKDDDGNILYEDIHHDYPEMIAVEYTAPPTEQERLARVRQRRDEMIRETDWQVLRELEEEMLQKGERSLSEQEFSDLLTERELLRNILKDIEQRTISLDDAERIVGIREKEVEYERIA